VKTTKQEWGAGPWHDEPDEEFGEAHGLRFAIKRHSSLGYLCGYVGVPPDHKLHGKSYGDEIAIDDVPHDWREARIDLDIGAIPAFLAAIGDRSDVIRIDLALHAHGGITYSEAGDDKYLPAGLHWFGFDCAHCDDLTPSSRAARYSWPATGEYRDIAYVRGECERLAKQLSEWK
jgi:hypothetical protein